MIEDKIKLILKEISDLRQDLKAVKSEIKKEEKIEDEQYVQLKKAYKELREQIKDLETDRENELAEDDNYNNLRKIRLEKEEELAHAREKLFENLEKLPKKAFDMSLDTEEGNVRVQVIPDMRIFMNGKEEKKNL